MPTVPEYSSPQVAPGGLGGASVQGLNPRQLAQGDITAQQTQHTGQDLMNLASINIDAVAKEQMLANQTRVDAALNNVRAAQQQLTYDPQQGYLNVKGQAAIQPDQDGNGLADTYGQKLQSTIDEASSGLANPAQQRVFAQQAAGLQTQFQGQLQNHVLGEYKQFGLQTQQGTVDLAQQSAEKAWSNPEVIDQSIQSAKSAVWMAGQIQGEPANLTEAKMLQTSSGIHAAVINAALQNNNPQYAMQYMQQYKDDMTAGDALKAQGMVRQDMTARVATSTAMNAMQQHQNALAPTDMDRVMNITSQSESGGRADAVGPNVPGQGTAKGSMQVMDATSKDPGFGVTPAQDDSPGERARVGKDYMAALISKYGGNTSQAWAAYNAGPGNVDKAISDAGQNGDWMGALSKYQSPDNHAQTVNYVAKNENAYSNGGGAPALPSIQDIHQNIRDQLGPNADPKMLQASLAEGTRMYADAMNDRKVNGENAVTQAQQYLIQNGGNFAAMPPDMKAAVVSAAPDKWDTLQNFGKNIANPPIVNNMAAYHTAIENPQELAAMPDSVFNNFVMTNFDNATQKQISKVREDEQSGKLDGSAGGLNAHAINAEMNNRLLSIGIDPKPKSEDDRARVGTIQKYINDSVFQQQAQLGRKMNSGEISDLVDKTFAGNSTFKGMLWGTNTSPTMSLKVSDIPSDDLDKVKAALSKNGNTNPSNDQILRTYWTGSKNNGGQ